jgi:hypothetical protein
MAFDVLEAPHHLDLQGSNPGSFGQGLSAGCVILSFHALESGGRIL